MADDFRGPAAKGFDWVHIIERHSDRGRIAQQRTSARRTRFTGLTEAQIKARVRGAWRKRSRVEAQTDPAGNERIRYRGTDPRSNRAIEFWFNVGTQIVETAYPVGE